MTVSEVADGPDPHKFKVDLMEIAHLRDSLRAQEVPDAPELLQMVIHYIASMEQLLINSGVWKRCHSCANPATKTVALGGIYGGSEYHFCSRCADALVNDWGGPAEVVSP